MFLCTGNSARSILAEALLEKAGHGQFRAYSAGSHPTGRVNPYAERQLRSMDIDPAKFRSKSWNEFAAPGAPAMDFVITVCDQAAEETCPAWPGQPVTAHWSIADPARIEGDDETKRRAFERVTRELNARIQLMVNLPIDKLDRLSLKRTLDRLGTSLMSKPA
jgi:arsenate reductase